MGKSLYLKCDVFFVDRYANGDGGVLQLFCVEKLSNEWEKKEVQEKTGTKLLKKDSENFFCTACATYRE